MLPQETLFEYTDVIQSIPSQLIGIPGRSQK